MVILGVDFDKHLRFDKHLNNCASKASPRVSALRRLSSFLDHSGILTLNKAQIRPYLEYSSLLWMSSAPSYIGKLDKIQRRALRLMDSASHPPHDIVTTVDSLEHRRDVAVLTVFPKAQVQEVHHLAGLMLPLRTAQRSTRTVPSSVQLVEVPRPRASQHQRTFMARVSRLRNIFTAAIPDVGKMTTQQAKMAAHRWRATLPTPLILLCT
ncbi:uncharacterized protein LOC121858379 [Homarus americanus]|uniref:uncharacterized protein LOC121858379 n=1 Tax=Homarus americanus TaxID=6706 RepID=UPI001C455F32|nr:uncharacterized protein LOC121858379 [Homarus americanus]